ncbi:hypothetical protein BC936DRAFT_145568 [Jimgerdemannia flammicorona]|uniref:Histidine phosphatase superfamily n=1 Tax=Jimgerdemannia flammicorona TaxID=994334 RepID=A0A433D9T3_9FUNG|nr:hypothetical protein BC936DRAFT_145568 [Jimgerdemannia flammicorona]
MAKGWVNRIDKNWQPDPSLGLWDPPLTPRGFLQAQKTGAYLTDLAKEKAALNPDFRVVIYTSPFQRCVDTTLGLAQGFHEACKPWMSDEWFDEDLAIANAQVSRYAAVDWGYKAVEQQFTYPESFNGMVARIGRTKRRLLEAIRKETEEMEEDKEVVSFKEEPTLLETEYCCLSKVKWVGREEEAGGGRWRGSKGEEGGRWVVEMEANSKHLKGTLLE